MSLERRQGYIGGSTVHKAQPLERPNRTQRPKKRPSAQRRKQKNIQYVNIFYTVFVVAAACMVLWSCVNYLQLQAELTGRGKSIASMEMQLEELKKENDDNYTRIMTSVDLNYIKDVAVNELGMVYADEDQVIMYDGGTKDYVRQNQEIPVEEESVIDQILGKKER